MLKRTVSKMKCFLLLALLLTAVLCEDVLEHEIEYPHIDTEPMSTAELFENVRRTSELMYLPHDGATMIHTVNLTLWFSVPASRYFKVERIIASKEQIVNLPAPMQCNLSF